MAVEFLHPFTEIPVHYKYKSEWYIIRGMSRTQERRYIFQLWGNELRIMEVTKV